MTVEEDGSGEEGKPATPSGKELAQELIEQFYQRAVERHGSDSEAARILSRFLKKE